MIYRMKQENKIFDLFKKNEHKLKERPSLQAWNKLERRLDQQSRNKGRKFPFSIYSLVMMAAASIALVFFISTLSNMAEISRNQRPVVIKETTPTESVKTYELRIEQSFREKYADILSRTVEEGSTGRMLIAKKKIRPFLVPRRS